MPPRGVSTWRRPYTSIYNDNYRYGTGLYSDTLSDIEKRYSESLNKTQLRSDRPDLAFTTFSGSNLTSSPNPRGESSSGRENVYFRRPLSPSPTPEITRSPTFENRLNATLKSAASALGEDVEDAINARIERRKQAIARQISESKAEAEEDEDFNRRLEIRKKAIAKAMSSSEVQSKSADSEEYVSKSKKTTTTEQQPLRPTSLYDDADLWTLPKKSGKLSELDLDMPKSRRKAAGGQTTTTNGPSSSRWKEKRRSLSPSPTPEITRSPAFENRLNATLKSAASALGEDVEEAVNARIERRQQAIARSISESKAEAEEDEDFNRRLEIRKKAIAKAMSSSEVTSKSTDSEEYESKSKKAKTTEQQPLQPTSLYDDAVLWILPKKSDKLSELDTDVPKSRRKAAGGQTTTTNGPSSSQWKEKSKTLQDQVDSLEKSMSSGSSRLKNELSTLKSKYNSEIYDLSGSVENTTQQATDLQKICRKQETQLKDLQTAYDSAQRNIGDVLEEMNLWQNKCKGLKKEMDRLREEVEMAVSKKSKA